MDRQSARHGLARPGALNKFQAEKPPQLIRYLERRRPNLSDAMFRDLASRPIRARDLLFEKARRKHDGGPFLIETDGRAEEMPIRIGLVRRRARQQQFRRRPLGTRQGAHDIDDRGECSLGLKAHRRRPRLVREVMEQCEVGLYAESDCRATRPSPGSGLQNTQRVANRSCVLDQRSAGSELGEHDPLSHEQTEMAAPRAVRAQLQQSAECSIRDRRPVVRGCTQVAIRLAEEIDGVCAEVR